MILIRGAGAAATDRPGARSATVGNITQLSCQVQTTSTFIVSIFTLVNMDIINVMNERNGLSL